MHRVKQENEVPSRLQTMIIPAGFCMFSKDAAYIYLKVSRDPVTAACCPIWFSVRSQRQSSKHALRLKYCTQHFSNLNYEFVLFRIVSIAEDRLYCLASIYGLRSSARDSLPITEQNPDNKLRQLVDEYQHLTDSASPNSPIGLFCRPIRRLQSAADPVHHQHRIRSVRLHVDSDDDGDDIHLELQ